MLPVLGPQGKFAKACALNTRQCPPPGPPSARLPSRKLPSAVLRRIRVFEQDIFSFNYTRPTARSSATQAQVNFVKVSDDLYLPFDIYKILRISTVASKDSCKRALDDLLRNPPEAGFSHQALYTRATLLKRSTDVLLDDSARRLYDQKLYQGDSETEVQSSEFPGALILLQESGNWDAVVQQGLSFLKNAEPQGEAAQDVALAVAQSYCDAAAAMLQDQGDGLAMLACDHMQAALNVLQAHAAFPQLQRDIEAAIGEMAPKLILHQVGLPLEDPGRARGVAGLTQLVSQGAPGWADLLNACRTHLTSSEVVSIAGACAGKSGPAFIPAFDVATAQLVAGCQRFEPQLVQEAFRMMQEAAPEGPGEAAVPFAVCCLLLGDSPAAEAILGFGPSPAGMHVDAAIQDFIKENCAEEDDLLPGLCLLAQQWLSDVAFAGFRDSQGTALSLGAWFEHPRVTRHLRATGGGPALGLGKAVQAAASRVKAAASRGASMVIGAAQAVTSVLPFASSSNPAEQAGSAQQAPVQSQAPAPSHGETPPSPPDTRPAVRQALLEPRDPELPARKAGQKPSRPVAEASTDAASAKQAMVTASLVIEPPSVTAAPGGPLSAVSARQAPQPLPSEEPSSRHRIRQKVPGGRVAVATVDGGVVDGIISFKEERDMWSGASTQSPLRRFFRRLFGWGIIMAAAMTGAVAMGIRPPSRVASAAIAVSQGASAIPSSQGSPSTASLTSQEAEEVLQHWQNLKAQSLGLKHDASSLARILEGPMLERWTSHIADSANSNQHVVYSCKDVQVDRVETGSESGVATVFASLHEKAELWSGTAPADSMESTYGMEYRLTRQHDGWKITSSSPSV
ncbi:hypothetical protein WJX84_007637 [Apatococcus fuscideae]|uniref:ARC6 IMS domain-containing protein n=1 Tax=Apatococcus fuscideae TaxID=2026836 RepID=A0AAW1SSH8_9CHLO